METLPSLSRSGGLEKGGDILKESKTQEDYRHFIHERLEAYLKRYPLNGHMPGNSTPAQRNSQSNILLLFRKLREGILAAQRVDAFALEAYETSLYLSVIFRAPAQTASVLAQLLPQGAGSGGLYDTFSQAIISSDVHPSSFAEKLGHPATSSELHRSTTRRLHHSPRQNSDAHGADNAQRYAPRSSSTLASPVPPTRTTTQLLSLLNAILQSYPSRSVYYEQLKIYQESTDNEHINQWLKPALDALGSRNYIRFEKLTRSSEMEILYRRSLSNANFMHSDSTHTEISMVALKCLVADLRSRARDASWAVLGAAYRELDIHQSANWLSRSLMLIPETGYIENETTLVRNWLGDRPASEVRQMDGASMEGRWLLCRRHYSKP